MPKFIYFVYVKAEEDKTNLNRVQPHYSKWRLAILSGYITVKSFVNWKAWKWLQKSSPGNQPGRNFKVTKKKEKPVCIYNSVELLASTHETLSLIPYTIYTKENIFFNFKWQTLNLIAFSVQVFELTNEQSCFYASTNKVGSGSTNSSKLCWVMIWGSASHPQPGFSSSVLKFLCFVFPNYTVF